MKFLDAAASLERFLGDPADPQARICQRHQLALDEEERFPQQAVDAIEAWGLHSFYVPVRLGGRLQRVDELLHVLRAVSRRDLTVAIGHAVTLLGAAPVWAQGSATTQARCAELILDGQPVSLALTEVEHGSDLVANECRLEPAADGGFRLHGEKWLINNATRCVALTVHANLAGVQGARAATLVWVEKGHIGPARYACLPKEPTGGIRGADISGIRFDGAELGETAVIGARGAGLEITLCSLQVTRTLCCGLSIGAGDTAVRTIFGFMQGRRLYGAALHEQAQARHLLARTFALQLVAESVALTAARLVHVAPSEMSVVASVAKYFVPATVETLFDAAESLLGARAYLRETPFAGFQKAKRDQQLVSLFEGNSIISLQFIALQLRQLAQRTLAMLERPGEQVELHQGAQRLFDLSHELDGLDFAGLALSGRGHDLVMQFSSCALMRTPGFAAVDERLRGCMQRWAQVHRELLHGVTVTMAGAQAGDPAWFDAARRYCSLYAAAAVFGLWYFNRDSEALPFDPVFRRGTWLPDVLGELIDGAAADFGAAPTGLYEWLERLVGGHLAVSILPYPCPNSVVTE